MICINGLFWDEVCRCPGATHGRWAAYRSVSAATANFNFGGTASIAFGRWEYSPKSIAFRVAKLRVDGPRKPPVHLDGSPQKDLWPLDVECKKGALRVFRKTRQ
jgi:diacylglycerol kinase family enzyme